MKKKASARIQKKAEPTKRQHRMACQLSDKEKNIVDGHIKKYGVTNRSRWMRETLLKVIYEKMLEDYPTLFNEHEMRR